MVARLYEVRGWWIRWAMLRGARADVIGCWNSVVGARVDG